MMKQEFEQMVGKEVSYETFEMYEKMYMALPESVDKQQFVSMLNLKAIPESEEAVARREVAERRRNEIRKEIAVHQEKIKELKRWLANDCDALENWLEEGDQDMIKYIRSQISYWRRCIKEHRNSVAELKFILQ